MERKNIDEMSREEIQAELIRYLQEDEDLREHYRTKYTRRTDYERAIQRDANLSTIPKTNELLMDVGGVEDSDSWKAMNEVREKKRIKDEAAEHALLVELLIQLKLEEETE